MRRLSENRSTPPTLRDGDLLVATVLPYSNRVHQFSMIVYTDGRFESCERLIGTRNTTSIFHKESGELGTAQLNRIQGLVAQFAEIADPVCDCKTADPFKFETNDRRSIGYFTHDGARTVCTWMLNLYNENDDSTEFLSLFNAIWEELILILDNRWFSIEQGFAGPARTNEENRTNNAMHRSRGSTDS